MRAYLIAALASIPGAIHADDAAFAYLEANLISTLYHELGHAVIHIQEVPIFGQEEDAADVLSTLLINAHYDEPAARDIITLAAQGYADDAAALEEPIPVWGVHGLDMQRYHTMACLFFGADVDTREYVITDLGLPEERAETCEEEYYLAEWSWGTVLIPMEDAAPTTTLTYKGLSDIGGEEIAFTQDLLIEQVAFLNESYALAKPVTVTLLSCGEANAFYDPETLTIEVCTEFAEDLFYRATR
ncbi:MAG: DUF4344 domain-containing metallopeptidase [Pseudomonadota bacterium]